MDLQAQKKLNKKLTLNRESLLRLDDGELRQVGGGFSGSGECTHGPSNCGKCTYHC